jgi:cellulose synthase/poly-beta-1,6-N-acetylglucosamine synthase-like glycosyltransferase
MVIGYAPYKIYPNDGFVKKILALEYFSHAAIAAATCGLDFPITCVGTNMAYLKKVYQEIGGFGKYKAFVSGDDDLFLTLVREHRKYKIYYAVEKNCHVYNAPPKSFNLFVQQRLRYASKGFNYPPKVTAGLTLYVLFNMALLAGLILGLLNNGPVLWSSCTILFLKTFFEFYFLNNAARILDDQRFITYYFATSILHIPYVLFFGIMGQFQFFKWAEKSAEQGINKK